MAAGVIRTLFIPDTHRPYHDKRAWSLLLKVARKWKPHRLVIGGDFADFYKASNHSKDPRRTLTLQSEVADVNVGLDELDAIGARDKHFIAGNHEFRLERYLMDKAPELFGIVEVSKLFRLKERGWSYVPYRSDVRIGKVYVTHDLGDSGRGAVGKALAAYEHNVIINHVHSINLLIGGNHAGESHVGASFGWLGDAKAADYMSRVKAARAWHLGFGVGYEADSITHLQPVPIVRYSCVVGGRLFRG